MTPLALACTILLFVIISKSSCSTLIMRTGKRGDNASLQLEKLSRINMRATLRLFYPRLNEDIITERSKSLYRRGI